MFKIFKDKRVGVLSALITGGSLIIAQSIGVLPNFFKSNTSPVINNNANGTQNVVLGDAAIYQNSYSDLKDARDNGLKEGVEIGYYRGVKSMILSGKKYKVPDEVVNKMFPIINGLSYLKRHELSQVNCSKGSVSQRDVCHFYIMKTGKKAPPALQDQYSKITKENDVRTEEQKQKGYGQLKVSIKPYSLVAPKINGNISAEERILKSFDPWYLACNEERGCRLLDLSNLSSELKTIKANDKVIKGAQVNKNEWFADYRLRMTGLFLQKDIIPLSPTKIESLIDEAGNS